MSLAVDDMVTEALESDNLQLQNLSGQKYVQANPMFLELVAKWQKNLGTVDSVLSTWLDVQKKWQALESIFIGSADIRVQLPEDSKRFDVINVDFQVRAAPCAACVCTLRVCRDGGCSGCAGYVLNAHTAVKAVYRVPSALATG